MYQESSSSSSFEVTETVTVTSSDGTSHTTTNHKSGGSSSFQSTSLIVTAVNLNTEKNKDIGKQDPYLRVSVNLEDKKSFQQTFTAKNAGKSAEWNQTFTIPLAGEPNLYVEVMDEETTVDGVIGFAAIPINQVVYAQGGGLRGVFDIFNLKKEVCGSVTLVLKTTGFETSSNQEPTNEVRGQSHVEEVQYKRCSSIHKKDKAVAIGAGLLGLGAAVGAGFLGKKIHDDHEKKEEEERQREEEENQRKADEERRRQELAQREEEENRRRGDADQREEELRRREEELARREQESRQRDEQESHKKKEECHKKNKDDDGDCHKKKKDDCHKKNRDDDEDCHKKKKDCDDKHSHKKRCADEWDPVGTYAAGDRVEYKGRTYVCLQGHTSNPTWEPTVAHSLWRTE